MMSPDPSQVQFAVHQALGRQDALDAVESLYGGIARRLDQIRPRCEMSGRCCRFEEYGHRLFVTTAELAAFVRLFAARRELHPLAALPDDGGCRFQQAKLCRAHETRPMGCRLFFCDPSHEQELQGLYEQMHAQLKSLHERFGIQYLYLEWRQGLDALAQMLKQAQSAQPG